VVSARGDAIVVTPWETMTADQRIEYLKTAKDELSGEITRLTSELQTERMAREEEDRRAHVEKEEVRRALVDLVSDAAAGLLWLESLVFALLVAGLVLVTWGALLT
jgi:hypothetical protein